MQGKSEGLYLFTRHSPDCKYHSEVGYDRDETRRCNCVKYVRGTAADGTRIRQSTGTASWERARKVLARLITEHDPTNKGLFNLALANGAVPERKSVKDAVTQFLENKRGENISDMVHYEGFFERELLPWCRERGIHFVDELTLELLIRFRNTWKNKGSVRNNKLARLRTFFAFCVDLKWVSGNIAKKMKLSQEDEPEVDYFHPDEMETLLNACNVSHKWKNGHDFKYRAQRLRAFILIARWTGMAMIDCVRFGPGRLQQNSDGIWTVMLRRQKNGNPVFVAVPEEVVEAIAEIPPVSEQYYFWTGNGEADTAVKAWARSLTYVFRAAALKRTGKSVRCHPHMFRHTFAIEKLLNGTPLHEVSLLLGHRSIKITERHYLKFDQRRQEQLIQASMSDWHQIQKPKPARKARVVVMKAGAGN